MVTERNVVGVDIGTMFICTASPSTKKDGNCEINYKRNMFLPIDIDYLMNDTNSSNIDCIKQVDDNNEIEALYIIGEDAHVLSKTLGKEPCRPMSKGVVSTNEIDAIDVMTMMVKKLINEKTQHCVYSIPEQSVDVDTPSIIYHTRVFNSIFTALKCTSKPLNEALAVIYANCASTNFTGIGISFGAGLTNVCCAYKGTPVLKFAVSRGGDWIDEEASRSIGATSSRISAIKERKLDLSVTKLTGTNKRERRAKESLGFYYKELIEYVIDIFNKQFNLNSDGLDIDESIPIIISGGTSKPPGFIELFKDVFNDVNDFPYDISEIRMATNPLHAVAEGCLLYGQIQDKLK